MQDDRASIIDITQAELADCHPVGAALLALNNAHEIATSRLDAARLRTLAAQAVAALRIGEADALLLALDQDAQYDSPNFRWFAARLARFVYVDRVIVAAHASGRGLGRRLYHALFRRALASGHDRVVCEVNLEPPNHASDGFHARLGFMPMGSATILGGAKTVRYLCRTLAAPDDAPGTISSAGTPPPPPD